MALTHHIFNNDVLLCFGFGPEAAGAAALSFRFAGMRCGLERCCQNIDNQRNKKNIDLAWGYT